MSKKLESATGLYLEGIRDGNMREALDKYTGDRYTQHSTGVADGKEGFIAFFEPFLERTPVRDIRVLRTIEDGAYVFCHVYQNLNDGAAQWVTADLFDTDRNDRVVEHWDVIQKYVAPTASGRTMVDGPTAIEDPERTEANKRHVRAFYDEVLLGGRMDKAADYISDARYDQHSPDVEDGLDGFVRHVSAMADRGTPRKYLKLHHLIGQGNLVVGYSHVQVGGDAFAVFDLFRLADGLIVEHWDVQEKILAPEHWNNSGKF